MLLIYFDYEKQLEHLPYIVKKNAVLKFDKTIFIYFLKKPLIFERDWSMLNFS